MVEQQYQDYFKHKPSELGPMSSQYWRDDPKLLGIHLARYKFVSKMLAGKTRVAEVGCGDGWFSKLVRREVGALHLYDFDPGFVEHINAQEYTAFVHDILNGALPYSVYSAIYSLDCFEHIVPDRADDYMRNIIASMYDDGVFICGIPSLESQKYASEASKAGHVNCMSGDKFKLFLEKYFDNVFLFSMHDETISTGFYPMAHYLMAVATNPK